MGKGGEIYVLDMGEPINIMDLAKKDEILSEFPLFSGLEPEHLATLSSIAVPKKILKKLLPLTILFIWAIARWAGFICSRNNMT